MITTTPERIFITHRWRRGRSTMSRTCENLHSKHYSEAHVKRAVTSTSWQGLDGTLLLLARAAVPQVVERPDAQGAPAVLVLLRCMPVHQRAGLLHAADHHCAQLLACRQQTFHIEQHSLCVKIWHLDDQERTALMYMNGARFGFGAQAQTVMHADGPTHDNFKGWEQLPVKALWVQNAEALMQHPVRRRAAPQGTRQVAEAHLQPLQLAGQGPPPALWHVPDNESHHPVLLALRAARGLQSQLRCGAD